MSHETELKFLLDDDNVAIVPEVGQDLAKAKSSHIDTIYYDTPDWELEQAGLTVRLRTQHGKTVLSIKSIGSDPISRTEREIEIAGDWPTDAEWTEVAAGTLLNRRDVRNQIEPRFTTIVDRANVKIKRQRSLLAVSADRGLLKANGQCDLPINEVELELISGDLKSLLNLGARITMSAPVRLSLISKGTRGALLARGRWAHPYSGTLPKISPDPGIAAAFKAICKTCLRDFMINEEAIKGPDPKEAVHESRIAIRRLRSALSLFKQDIDDRELKPLAQHIKVLSDLLGQARDLDVVMEESTTWPKHNAKCIYVLIERLGHSQMNARRDLQNALGSEGHRRFAFDFVKWLEEGTWAQGNGKIREPVMVEGSNLLKTQLAKLVRQGKQLKRLQNPELHEIRKDAKKLRYMSEFFASLLSDELIFDNYSKLLGALQSTQKALGKQHDKITQAQLLKMIIQQPGDPNLQKCLKKARKIIIANAKGGDRRQLKKAVKAFRIIRDQRDFWEDQFTIAQGKAALMKQSHPGIELNA